MKKSLRGLLVTLGVGLSILTNNCLSSPDQSEKINPSNFIDSRYEHIFLMNYKGIGLGYDTNNDKREDLRFVYNVKGQDKNGISYLERNFVLKDENNNGIFDTNEVWENTNEGIINEKYKGMFMKVTGQILTEGFDTDNDGREDLRYTYYATGADSNGILSLKLEKVEYDKNKDGYMESDETIWEEGDYLPQYNGVKI